MRPDLNLSIDAYKMLESMTESVLITTAELDAPGPYIIYVNPAFEEMTGWKKKELIGQSPRILQGEKTDYQIFEDLREKLSRGETWSGRTVNYKKDGSAFYMQWSIVPIRSKQGRVHQYLAVQKDVSDIVRTENNLKVSRREEKKRMRELHSTNRKLNELIQKQKETLELFVKYVPEPVVQRSLTDDLERIREGEQLEVGLLFCDIRRFTTIAEKLRPNEVVYLLNVYYSMMSEVVKKHDGFINQFVGDEIFVTFGAPLPIDDPEISAVKCAQDMIEKLDKINFVLKDLIEEPIVVGIGVNYGPIIAGNLGSDDRLSYSITGDAVNTAKRIESLTEGLPNTVLISQSIFDKAKSIISTKPWGEVEIKGKNEKVKVYQMLD